ncbi:MAG: Ig-like domain-containing protein [Clostridia bacterium]
MFVLLYGTCARAQVRMDILMNERMTVPSDGQTYEFIFTPTTNNLYEFSAFGEGTASAMLYLENQAAPVVSADGFTFKTRLIADATYRLVVTSRDAPVEVEIMRATLGRSFAQPIELADPTGGYDKVIARAYDTHWYRFTAPESGLYVIRSTSEMNTIAHLFDERGVRLAVNDNLYSPYCLDFRIQHHLEAGRVYYVRVSGRASEVGSYHLTIAGPEKGTIMPEALTLSSQSLTLKEQENAQLTYAIAPAKAFSDVVWVSGDRSIATVDQSGLVTARAAGETWTILTGVGGVDARCKVLVQAIPVTGVTLAEQAYTVRAGETLTLAPLVAPENASNKRVKLESSDPGVVSVEKHDLLTARAPGEAVVTATTADGGFAVQARITVQKPRSNYRALVIGEQRYVDGTTRVGSINTAQGMADLLSRQRYDGKVPEVTVRLDSTRTEAIDAIRSAFEQATQDDVSILYITCHGGVTSGQAWIEFHDGKRLTAQQLEKELHKVKGTVVLLIDCCQSGGFITTKARVSFGGQLVQAFSAGSAGRFASSKYRILASTSAVQDSYRLSADGTKTEVQMSTVFARSLAEGGGWDIIGDRATRMRADVNQDRKVTLHEAYLYAWRQTRDYLTRAKVTQDVQIYPRGSQFILFERNVAE